MKENWYALLMAIFSDISVTSAVKYCKYGIETKDFKENFLKRREIIVRKNGVDFSEEKIIESIEYKKTHTWGETAEYFNINVSTLRSKISRRDTKPPTKVDLVSKTKGLNNKPIIL